MSLPLPRNNFLTRAIQRRLAPTLLALALLSVLPQQPLCADSPSGG